MNNAIKECVSMSWLFRILLPDNGLFFLRAQQSKKEQDSGEYWCRAFNSGGSVTSRRGHLQVACELFSIKILGREIKSFLDRVILRKYLYKCYCSNIAEVYIFSGSPHFTSHSLNPTYSFYNIIANSINDDSLAPHLHYPIFVRVRYPIKCLFTHR